jgi:Arabinose-binding domain of AraC transcription regulator, N-term
MMRRSSTQQSIRQLASMPRVGGGLTRLAAGRARRAGIKLEPPLLSRAGLTIDQIDDPEQRISAGSQIAFLETIAEELDDLLGLTLAKEFDCRDLGLLYYVMASSDTLGDALRRVARYSRITNEALVLQYREARDPALRLTYSGVQRHADRHQMEFCIVAVVRMSRPRLGLTPFKLGVAHKWAI